MVEDDGLSTVAPCPEKWGWEMVSLARRALRRFGRRDVSLGIFIGGCAVLEKSEERALSAKLTRRY